jgi:beta-lactam-binding protein with PASTA domain
MIRIDTSELDHFAVEISSLSDKTKDNVQKVLNNTGFNIEAQAKINLDRNKSVVTGHLRRGITTKIGNMEVTVHTSNIKYAPMVEYGTKAHIIKAKNKKALYWKGASHPVKSVRHPGSKAKPYLIPAFEKEKDTFINDLKEVIEW